MKITIIHFGGTEKLVELESFAAPRPWVCLRYPGGGGLFSFALAHGGIECKRSLTPEWRICEAELETLREQARALKIKFTVVEYRPHVRAKPGAPLKKTPQEQVELFAEPDE